MIGISKLDLSGKPGGKKDAQVAAIRFPNGCFGGEVGQQATQLPVASCSWAAAAACQPARNYEWRCTSGWSEPPAMSPLRVLMAHASTPNTLPLTEPACLPAHVALSFALQPFFVPKKPDPAPGPSATGTPRKLQGGCAGCPRAVAVSGVHVRVEQNAERRVRCCVHPSLQPPWLIV